MQQFGPGRGEPQHSGVDLIRRQLGQPFRFFRLKTHADPDIGVNVIGIFYRLIRIFTPGGGSAALLENRRIRREVARRGDHQLHAGEFRCQHQRVGDVARTVADKDRLDLQRPRIFEDGE
ncbi:hypothetical protein SDC9_112430 [bioreactor metagenome]|uniref:Uncharacterized protein n=1 Tax=bioreactor metagenome TaxID=1076179 RepID=A0A645BQM8_9ZZZZ